MLQIILVDDASTMEHLKQPLEEDIKSIPKARHLTCLTIGVVTARR